MPTMDAKTKGGSLDSGTSHKEGFHGESVDSHGMGAVGRTGPTVFGHKESDGKQNKPAPNPAKKVSRNQTIK